MKDKNEQTLYEWLSEDLKPVSDILCTAKKFFCFRRFRLEGLPYCRGEWGECSYQQKKNGLKIEQKRKCDGCIWYVHKTRGVTKECTHPVEETCNDENCLCC